MNAKIGYLCKVCIAVLFISIGLFLILFSKNIHQVIINSNMVLEPNSNFYKAWEHVPILLPMDFYLFNWTNPQDILNSSTKPEFHELGPYRFMMDLKKVEVVWNNNNGTISYKMQKTWFFDQKHTHGSLQDLFTTINVPTLVASHMAQSWNYFIRKGLSFTISNHISQIHVTRTVNDMLFEGYPDSFTKMGSSLPMFTGKDVPKWDRFGFFYKRNGTLHDEKIYNVGTGQYSDFGETYNWNYWSQTPFYEGKCGKVIGSNGERFNASSNTITMYMADLCRSLILEYVGDEEVSGIVGRKYVMDKKTLDNGSEIAENACYCPGNCMPSGVFNMSSCRYGSPTFLSLPHFYKADPYYRSLVKGLEPVKGKHEFFMIIEPQTGIPLKVNVRLQMNMLMHPVESIRMYEEVPTVYFPIMWFDQAASIPEDNLTMFKLLLRVPTILISCGVVLIIVGFAILTFMYLNKAKKKTNYRNSEEDVPLNKKSTIIISKA